MSRVSRHVRVNRLTDNVGDERNCGLFSTTENKTNRKRKSVDCVEKAPTSALHPVTTPARKGLSNSGSMPTDINSSSTSAPYHLPPSTSMHHQGLQGVFVENLPPVAQLSDQGLREQLLSLFKKFGKPIDISLSGEPNQRKALILLQKVYDMDKMLSESNQFMLHSDKMEVRLADVMAVTEAHNAFLAMASVKASSTNMGGLQGAHFGANNSSCGSKGSSFANMASSSNSSSSGAVIDILEKRATRTLYVGSLETRTTDERLKELFGRFGHIVDIDVKNFESPMPFAFIQFADIQSVARALEFYGAGGNAPNSQGDQSPKLRIKANWARLIATNKLWIGSLPNACTHESLSSKLRVVFPDTVTEVIFDDKVHEAIVVFTSTENALLAHTRIKSKQFALLSENDREVVHVPVDFCSEKLYDYFAERRNSRLTASEASKLSSGAAAGKCSGQSDILDPPPNPPHTLKKHSHLSQHNTDVASSSSEQKPKIDGELSRDSSSCRPETECAVSSNDCKHLPPSEEEKLRRSSQHQCHSSPCASCRHGKRASRRHHQNSRRRLSGRQRYQSKSAAGTSGSSGPQDEVDGHSSDTSVSSSSSSSSGFSTAPSTTASETLSQLKSPAVEVPILGAAARSASPLCPPPPAPAHLESGGDHKRVEMGSHAHPAPPHRSRSRWPFSEIMKVAVNFPQETRGGSLPTDPRINRPPHPVPHSLPLPPFASHFCSLPLPSASAPLTSTTSRGDALAAPHEGKVVVKKEPQNQIDSYEACRVNEGTIAGPSITVKTEAENEARTFAHTDVASERKPSVAHHEYSGSNETNAGSLAANNDESLKSITITEFPKAGCSPPLCKSNGTGESNELIMMSPRPSTPDSHNDVASADSSFKRDYAVRMDELNVRLKEAQAALENRLEKVLHKQRKPEDNARNGTTPGQVGERRGSSFEQELERIRNRTSSVNNANSAASAAAAAVAAVTASGSAAAQKTTPTSSTNDQPSLHVITALPPVMNSGRSKNLPKSPPVRSSFSMSSSSAQHSSNSANSSSTHTSPKVECVKEPSSVDCKPPFIPPEPPSLPPPVLDPEMPTLQPVVPLEKLKERVPEKEKERHKEREKDKEKEKDREKVKHEKIPVLHKVSTKITPEIKLANIDELFSDPIPVKKIKTERKQSGHEDQNSRKESISKKHDHQNDHRKEDPANHKNAKKQVVPQPPTKDNHKKKEKEKLAAQAQQRLIEEKKAAKKQQQARQQQPPLPKPKPKPKKKQSPDSSEDEHPKKSSKKAIISSDESSTDSDEPVKTKFEKEMQEFLLEEMASGSMGLSMYDRVKRRSSAPKTDEAKNKNKTLEFLREQTNKRKRENKPARRVHVESSDEEDARAIHMQNDSDTTSSLTTSSRKSKKEVPPQKSVKIQKPDTKRNHQSDSDDWEKSQTESTRRAVKKGFVPSSSNESEDVEPHMRKKKNSKSVKIEEKEDPKKTVKLRLLEKEKAKEKERKHREKEKEREKTKEKDHTRKRPASVLSNNSQEERDAQLVKVVKKIKQEEVVVAKKPKISAPILTSFSMFPDLERREEQVAAASLAKKKQKESRMLKHLENSEPKKRPHDMGVEKLHKRIKTEPLPPVLTPQEPPKAIEHPISAPAPKLVSVKKEIVEFGQEAVVAPPPKPHHPPRLQVQQKAPILSKPVKIKIEPIEEREDEICKPREPVLCSTKTSPTSRNSPKVSSISPKSSPISKASSSNRASPSTHKSSSSSSSPSLTATVPKHLPPVSTPIRTEQRKAVLIEEIASGTVAMRSPVRVPEEPKICELKQAESQSEVIEQGRIGVAIASPKALADISRDADRDRDTDQEQTDSANEDLEPLDEDDDEEGDAADEAELLRLMNDPAPEPVTEPLPLPVFAPENVQETEDAVQSISNFAALNESEDEDSFGMGVSMTPVIHAAVVAPTMDATVVATPVSVVAEEGKEKEELLSVPAVVSVAPVREEHPEKEMPLLLQETVPDEFIEREIKTERFEETSENSFAHMDEVINNIAHGNSNIEDAVLLKSGKGKKYDNVLVAQPAAKGSLPATQSSCAQVSTAQAVAPTASALEASPIRQTSVTPQPAVPIVIKQEICAPQELPLVASIPIIDITPPEAVLQLPQAPQPIIAVSPVPAHVVSPVPHIIEAQQEQIVQHVSPVIQEPQHIQKIEQPVQQVHVAQQVLTVPQVQQIHQVQSVEQVQLVRQVQHPHHVQQIPIQPLQRVSQVPQVASVQSVPQMLRAQHTPVNVQPALDCRASVGLHGISAHSVPVSAISISVSPAAVTPQPVIPTVQVSPVVEATRHAEQPTIIATPSHRPIIVKTETVHSAPTFTPSPTPVATQLQSPSSFFQDILRPYPTIAASPRPFIPQLTSHLPQIIQPTALPPSLNVLTQSQFKSPAIVSQAPLSLHTPYLIQNAHLYQHKPQSTLVTPQIPAYLQHLQSTIAGPSLLSPHLQPQMPSNLQPIHMQIPLQHQPSAASSSMVLPSSLRNNDPINYGASGLEKPDWSAIVGPSICSLPSMSSIIGGPSSAWPLNLAAVSSLNACSLGTGLSSYPSTLLPHVMNPSGIANLIPQTNFSATLPSMSYFPMVKTESTAQPVYQQPVPIVQSQPVPQSHLRLPFTAPVQVKVEPEEELDTPENYEPGSFSAYKNVLQLKYPFMWQGHLVMKKHEAMVRMQFVGGNRDLLERCKAELLEENQTFIRFNQRMRMSPSQLEGVRRRMLSSKEYLALLCHPCGITSDEVQKQAKILTKSFVRYFQSKEAAGIAKEGNQKTQTPSLMIHLFPPGEFTNQQLQLHAPEIKDFAPYIDGKFMYLIITPSALPT